LNKNSINTNRLSSKSCWIFDLDGTLTKPVHDFDFIRRELGIPTGADILGHLDTLPESEANKRQARLKEIETDLAHKAQPSTGALEVVEMLHNRGTSLGILTRNDKDIALLTLDTIGAGNYFDAENVLGRCDALPKPDPDGIFRLLSGWGRVPEDAVMVGDYLFDLLAGRAAGTSTVHIERPDGFLWPELTDFAVPTLLDLVIHLSL